MTILLPFNYWVIHLIHTYAGKSVYVMSGHCGKSNVELLKSLMCSIEVMLYGQIAMNSVTKKGICVFFNDLELIK